MAALLKKRALAEYSQSQTTVIAIAGPSSGVSEEAQGQPSAPKRLRIVKKPTSGSVSGNDGNEAALALEGDINLLDGSHGTTINFRALSRIAAYLPSTISNESLLKKKLVALFHSDKDLALKAKCLTIFQLLTLTPEDSTATIEEIIRLISKETSHLVLISGLNVVLKLAVNVSDITCKARLVSLAKKFIKNTDDKVKCKCLEILGALTSYEDPSVVTDTIQFVHCYSHSHDPRVRSTSFKVMQQLHEKGAPLDVSIYTEVVKYLDDDYEIVKLASVQLLWALSQAYPEHMIPIPTGGEKMRLVDDAFAKTCNAINDPCVQVRVLAAQLLGRMPQVGQAFLDQTLDKKLMSDMRRKRSAHERQREKVRQGEWSSGKKWADDAPKEIIDADSVSLINSGGAGAFVHGLEDEFMEVRSAAVDSLCTLSLMSPAFGNLALDFLVDMFNDEIEDVRLKAIDSLTKISRHIVLWEDQLEIVLSALEDSSIDIREGLHKLLAVCTLMTKDCVKLCLENLLENLKKYPQDKKSIWKCLEGVGIHHPWVILPLVPQLLSQHPFFDTSETDPEDPAYVSVLILVLNGAKGCPTMKTLFDEKLTRHYHYLRDTLPHLVPDLSEFISESENISGPGTSGSIVESGGKGSSLEGNGRILLKELVGKLRNTGNISTDMKLRLSKLILKDLKRLAEVDQEISAVAKFTALYIRAQLIYTHCLNSSAWTQLSSSISAIPSQNESLRVQIESFLHLCLKMQYSFNGLIPSEYAIVMQLKLRALALQLVYIVRGSNASALAACQSLLEQAEVVLKYLEANKVVPDEFNNHLFELLDSLDDPKPGTVVKLLLPLFQRFHVPLVSFSSSVKMASASIIEPTGESETPMKFTAGLLLGIPFDCELKNLTDTSHVRIRVKYPDQQVHLICPRMSDFRISSLDETRLLTTVNASHQAWTEPCPISLSVVLDLSGPETNYNRKLVGKNNPTYTIELSDEKQVLVAPKPAKRGI